MIRFSRFAAVAAGLTCVAAGVYLLQTQSLGEESSWLETIAHGMGIYFIGKGVFVWVSVLMQAEVVEALRARSGATQRCGCWPCSPGCGRRRLPPPGGRCGGRRIPARPRPGRFTAAPPVTADGRLPAEVRARIEELERRFCEEVRCVDPRDVAETLSASAPALHDAVAPFLRPGARVLEVGSGYGFGLADLLRRGVDAVGVEPGAGAGFDGRYAEALQVLAASGIADPGARLFEAAGERLPFPDASFDVVVSVTVLEHVRDVRAVLDESLRVARPGGVVVANVPNFDTFGREGHYGVPWLPYLLRSRRAARWWVRRFGRADWFVDELNFTTPGRLRRLVGGLPGAELDGLVVYVLPRFGEVQRRAYNAVMYGGRARRPVGRAVLRLLELGGAVTGFQIRVRRV